MPSYTLEQVRLFIQELVSKNGWQVVYNEVQRQRPISAWSTDDPALDASPLTDEKE